MAIAERITYIACEAADESIPDNNTVYPKNLIPFADVRLDDWTAAQISGGTVSIDAEGLVATCSTTGSGQRAYIATTIPTGVFTATDVLALGCYVEIVSGVPTKDTLWNGITESSGDDRQITNSTGRWCTIITTSTNTGDIRIGLGVLTGEGASSVSIKISQPFLYVVASESTAPHDWVPSASQAPLIYANGNTVASGGGLITEAQGTAINNPANLGLFGIGCSDSFGNDASEWPSKFSWNLRGIGIYMESESSRTLVDMETTWSDHINANNLSSAYPAFSFAVIQGGVNDLIGDETLANLQAAIQSMVDIALKAGIGNVFIIDIAPFGGHASHTAGRETVRVNYNDWLRYTYAKTRRVFICRASQTLAAYTDRTLLADGTGSDPDYSTGGPADGLHPNAEGSAAIAATLQNSHDAIFSQNRIIARRGTIIRDAIR